METDQKVNLIIRNAAKLPYSQRVKVAEQIMAHCVKADRTDADDRYAVLLPIAEEVVGRQMTASRDASNVMIRRFVAFRLRSEGYAYTDIAAAMGRHHSTVIHYVRTMQDCFDEPIFYASDLNLYMCFAEGAGHVE